jgi:hypothetical protein
MQLQYTVNSAHRGPVRVPATVGDQQVAAFTADGLVVELLSGDMSHTLQIATDLDAAEALFQPGAVIVATFAAPPPAKS